MHFTYFVKILMYLMCIFKNNLFKLKKDVHTRMFMFEYIYHKLKELPLSRGNEVDE